MAVRVQPKAAHNRIEGLETDDRGVVRLKVRVTAVPESGKANTALLKLLARDWGVPVRRLAVTAGRKSRHKVILVKGDSAPLERKLESWLRAISDQ